MMVFYANIPSRELLKYFVTQITPNPSSLAAALYPGLIGLCYNSTWVDNDLIQHYTHPGALLEIFLPGENLGCVAPLCPNKSVTHRQRRKSVARHNEGKNKPASRGVPKLKSPLLTTPLYNPVLIV